MALPKDGIKPYEQTASMERKDKERKEIRREKIQKILTQ